MAPDIANANVSRDRAAAKPPVSVADARRTMLAAIAALPSETIALESARGRILAESIAASRDQPPFDTSSMDGYAVRSADTPGRLRLAGESAAGRAHDRALVAGEVVRISTGAPLPGGADGVAIQEDVALEQSQVIVPGVAAGSNVRRRGMDFRSGTILLQEGRRLDGVAVALAAAAGVARLAVGKRPRVAILSSGDELVAAGAQPGPFQIFDSATPGVAALIGDWGGIAEHLAIERDDVNAIARAAARGLRDHDLLVVIGGASVGDHDHAKPALAQLGLRLTVDRIAVRPGKPTWFGLAGATPVLGLPGNPASALACAYLFLRPILETMSGRDGEPHFRRARLTGAMPANGPREHYLRARLDADDDGQLTVRAFEQQDSSLLSVFSAANALIRIAASAAPLDPGALVEVLPLRASW